MKRIVALIVLLAMMVPLALPGAVWAATETITVSAEGTYTNGTYAGGAANFTNLQSDDGDTTYISTFSTGYYHSYNFTNMAAASPTISAVTFYFKSRMTGSSSSTFRPFVVIGGVTYIAPANYTDTLNYTLQSYTWSVNPATGTAWTKTVVDAAEFGLYYSYVVDQSRWTYAYVVITYSAASIATLTAQDATSLTTTTASLHGTITATGGANPSLRGFVWSTASNVTMPDSAQAPPATYTANNTEAGSFSTGSFSDAATALTVDTKYYFRAYAYNSAGYAYSDEWTFTTVGTPTGTTNSAINVGTTTARLIGTVTDDGRQACDVRFGWDTVSRATIALYTNKTTWQNNTYTTGQFPYSDLTGLVAGTTYYFRVQIENDAGVVEGDELTFVAGTTVGVPSSFVAIPSSTSIQLSWVKGTSSVTTLVKYAQGAYPATTADGTYVYFDSAGSTTLTGLTPGVTYYFSAWGYSGGTYSATAANTMATTVGASIPTASNSTKPEISSWVQTPDASKIQNIPVVSWLATWVSDAYNQPINYLWYFLWLAAAGGLGVIIFNKSNNSQPATLVVEIGWMGIGVVLGLTMLWVVIGILIIALGVIMFGDRR